MRKSQFTEEQIVTILREHEAGATVAEVSRRHGVSEQTVYRWKQKYDGLASSELQRLKELEAENARLKRLVAEQALDNQMLKELLAKTGEACSAPDFAVSERRACRLIGFQRSTLRYHHPDRVKFDPHRPVPVCFSLAQSYRSSGFGGTGSTNSGSVL